MRPKLLAWLIFLVAFGTTVALGTWQVERLAWKKGLMAELAAAQAQPPLVGIPTESEALAAAQFQRVTVQGSWVKDVEFHIAPRYVLNKFGYALVQPFRLGDGRVLLVNRGWIPGKKKLPQTRPELAVHGKATLTGMLRIDRDRARFTPENQPEKNLWFARDVADMAAYAHLKNVVPATLDVVGELPERITDTTPLPIPSDGTIRLRNDHLSYILTWYGIAAGVLVIFVLSHRRKRVG